MNMLDYEDRWTYHGSLTTPPCTPAIYWNVIRRVLPIEPMQFERYQQKNVKNQMTIGGITNNRIIQPIVNHNIRFIGAVKLAVSALAIIGTCIY